MNTTKTTRSKCSIIGTGESYDYLKDSPDGQRFWPTCKATSERHDSLTPEESKLLDALIALHGNNCSDATKAVGAAHDEYQE